MVHVLVGEHEPLQVLDAAPVPGERALERVERLARVRADVDERQRVVLDEVDVDAPDGERRRDGEPVDPRGGEPVLGAHERMIPSTSSRRASMSSCETRLSSVSRSSGSVLEARTLKCQSS